MNERVGNGVHVGEWGWEHRQYAKTSSGRLGRRCIQNNFALAPMDMLEVEVEIIGELEMRT
jgi:hypothetical protein